MRWTGWFAVLGLVLGGCGGKAEGPGGAADQVAVPGPGATQGSGAEAAGAGEPDGAAAEEGEARPEKQAAVEADAGAGAGAAPEAPVKAAGEGAAAEAAVKAAGESAEAAVMVERLPPAPRSEGGEKGSGDGPGLAPLAAGEALGGPVVWEAELAKYAAAVAVGREHVHVLGEGTLEARSRVTGERVWAQKLGKGEWLRGVAGDLVLVGGEPRALAATDGRELWRAEGVGGAIEAFAANERHVAVLYRKRGKVAVYGLALLDGRSGEVLSRSQTVGPEYEPIFEVAQLGRLGERFLLGERPIAAEMDGEALQREWDAYLAGMKSPLPNDRSPFGQPCAVEVTRAGVVVQDGRGVRLLGADLGEKWSWEVAGGEPREEWLGATGPFYACDAKERPAGDDELVYVIYGLEDEGVYALERATGKLRWRAKGGDEPFSEVHPIDEGVVALGATSARVLDRRTGEVLWRHELSYAMRRAVAGTEVYAGVDGARQRLIRADVSRPRTASLAAPRERHPELGLQARVRWAWRYPQAVGNAARRPLVDGDAVVLPGERAVVALSLEDGARRWLDAGRASPQMLEWAGLVLVDGRAIDLKTGKVRWRAPARVRFGVTDGGQVSQGMFLGKERGLGPEADQLHLVSAGSGASTYVDMTAPDCVHAGKEHLYFGVHPVSEDAEPEALAKVGREAADDECPCAFAEHETLFTYFSAREGGFVARRIRDGSVAWTSPAEGTCASPAHIGGDVVYATTGLPGGGARLHALNAKSGASLWTRDFPAGAEVTTTSRGAAVSTGREVHLLAPDTGATRWSIVTVRYQVSPGPLARPLPLV